MFMSFVVKYFHAITFSVILSSFTLSTEKLPFFPCPTTPSSAPVISLPHGKYCSKGQGQKMTSNESLSHSMHYFEIININLILLQSQCFDFILFLDTSFWIVLLPCRFSSTHHSDKVTCQGSHYKGLVVKDVMTGWNLKSERDWSLCVGIDASVLRWRKHFFSFYLWEKFCVRK